MFKWGRCRTWKTYRENGRRVVVDGVDTGAVLPEEEHATNEETPLKLGTGTERLEWLPESESDSVLLHLVNLVDAGNLLLNIGVGVLKLANPAQVLDGLFASVLEEQPARGLRQQHGTKQEQSRGD